MVPSIVIFLSDSKDSCILIAPCNSDSFRLLYLHTSAAHWIVYYSPQTPHEATVTLKTYFFLINLYKQLRVTGTAHINKHFCKYASFSHLADFQP